MGCMSKAQFTCAVVPQYLEDQSNPVRHEYAFAYTVTIVNSGDVPAQLIGRHWIITDATGRTEEVRGLGVVGHQPLLQPGEQFQYTSGCHLRTATGTMHGSFFCVAEDGERFEVDIPIFVLDALSTSQRTLH